MRMGGFSVQWTVPRWFSNIWAAYCCNNPGRHCCNIAPARLFDCPHLVYILYMKLIIDIVFLAIYETASAMKGGREDVIRSLQKDT